MKHRDKAGKLTDSLSHASLHQLHIVQRKANYDLPFAITVKGICLVFVTAASRRLELSVHTRRNVTVAGI